MCYLENCYKCVILQCMIALYIIGSFDYRYHIMIAKYGFGIRLWSVMFQQLIVP